MGRDRTPTSKRHDLSDRVRVTLDHLPRPYGDVLTWKYIEGLSVVEDR